MTECWVWVHNQQLAHRVPDRTWKFSAVTVSSPCGLRVTVAPDTPLYSVPPHWSAICQACVHGRPASPPFGAGPPQFPTSPPDPDTQPFPRL